MSQQFDVNEALKEALQKIVTESKENGLVLFKDFMPALLKQAIDSIDYWVIGNDIQISEMFIATEVGNCFTGLFQERKMEQEKMKSGPVTVDQQPISAEVK